MCEPRAWKWTPEADRALAMIAARNELRRGAYPPAAEPMPAYSIQPADRPREPAYA